MNHWSMNWFQWSDLLLSVGFAVLLLALYGVCARFPDTRRPVFRTVYILLRPVVFLSFVTSRLRHLFQRNNRVNVSGSCRRCGTCCWLLALEIPSWMIRREYLQNIIVWYYQVNYGFHYHGLEENSWLVFSCPHLDPEGFCRIYRRRPRVCREFPDPYAKHRPDLAPRCGYHWLEETGQSGIDESGQAGNLKQPD